MKWVQKNMRALGKIGLYGAGGVMIGMPAIRFASNVWAGNGIEASAKESVSSQLGYNIDSGAISNERVRGAAVRTGLGALAILLAKKI